MHVFMAGMLHEPAERRSPYHRVILMLKFNILISQSRLKDDEKYMLLYKLTPLCLTIPESI